MAISGLMRMSILIASTVVGLLVASCDKDDDDAEKNAVFVAMECPTMDVASSERIGLRVFDGDGSMNGEFVFTYRGNLSEFSESLVKNGIKNLVTSSKENKNSTLCFLGSPISTCHLVNLSLRPDVYATEISEGIISLQFADSLQLKTATECQ